MKTHGTLLFHGYGVRSGTWNTVRAALGDRAGAVAAPDLDADTVDDLIALARGRARRFSLETDGPILAVGHSLGGILAALVAQNPGAPVVAGAVIIAAPYGERENAPGPLTRFLLRHRLIPPALLRPRFFSSQTPPDLQREVFANAVAEAPALRELTVQPRHFHTDLFTGPLPVPSLVIASEADRIVPASQSRAFAEVLGSETLILPARERVGHDDFFASPAVARRTADAIADFAARLG
jgi:predicted alpha/beta hydrolase family esterase